MPFVLTGFGLILVLTGINNTYAQFGAQFQQDLISNGFLKWAVGIMIIGALGYIQPLKPVSVAFLTLILVALFLANKGGVFQSATNALNNVQQQSQISTQGTTQ